MKRTRFFASSLLWLAATGCSQSKPQTPAPAPTTTTTTPTTDPPPADDPPPVPTPFAVAELFTSEGCNSCPAAEDFLAKLVSEAQPNVYPLAFHVDYWDYTGWKDRFDSKAYTDRQKAYGKALGKTSLYTPQMIVNGRTEFVGSQESTGRARIAAALGKEPSVGVSVKLDSDDGTNMVVKYVVASAPAEAVLNVVIAERGLVVTPTAGENKGVKLHHENVVRALVTVPSSETSGTVTLAPSAEVKRGNSSIVGYVQLPGTMESLGAAIAPAKP